MIILVAVEKGTASGIYKSINLRRKLFAIQLCMSCTVGHEFMHHSDGLYLPQDDYAKGIQVTDDS